MIVIDNESIKAISSDGRKRKELSTQLRLRRAWNWQGYSEASRLSFARNTFVFGIGWDTWSYGNSVQGLNSEGLGTFCDTTEPWIQEVRKVVLVIQSLEFKEGMRFAKLEERIGSRGQELRCAAILLHKFENLNELQIQHRRSHPHQQHLMKVVSSSIDFPNQEGLGLSLLGRPMLEF